jgi:aldose 1-epimerase
VPPSGEQLTLRQGSQRVSVVSVGGGIREYTVDGVPVLDGYGSSDMCDGARGQLLLPWPNRIRGGRYAWRGAEHQLPLTEPALGNAIHGLTRWVAWAVTRREEAHVVLEHLLYPQDGYPFALALRAAYELDPGGLRVRVSATNTGSEPCPFGAGAHPYLTAGDASVDTCSLEIRAATSLRTDSQHIPCGAGAVTGTSLDFRSPRPIGGTVLDTAFTDLARDAAGIARVVLDGPSGRRTLWMDATFRYVMIFTGDTLAPERRRRSIAVEPMSCAPNAFQTGEGLVTLEPGETVSCDWGIVPG